MFETTKFALQSNMLLHNCHCRLAIRSFIKPGDSFKQLLQAERAALLGAMAHADVPFATVVSELGIKRNQAYTPLIQAMMTTDDMGKRSNLIITLSPSGIRDTCQVLACLRGHLCHIFSSAAAAAAAFCYHTINDNAVAFNMRP